MKHIRETPKESFRNHSQAMPNHGNPLVVQSLNSVNTALRRWIKCPVVRCLWFSIRNWPQKLTLPKQSLGDLNPLIYRTRKRNCQHNPHPTVPRCIHYAFLILWAAPRRACRSVGSAHRCSSPVRCRGSKKGSSHAVAVANPCDPCALMVKIKWDLEPRCNPGKSSCSSAANSPYKSANQWYKCSHRASGPDK